MKDYNALTEQEQLACIKHDYELLDNHFNELFFKYLSCYQALQEIEEIANVLITETNEYDSCYYKDTCGDNCYPKQKIIEKEKQNPCGNQPYCNYEAVNKILDIINKTCGAD